MQKITNFPVVSYFREKKKHIFIKNKESVVWVSFLKHPI